VRLFLSQPSFDLAAVCLVLVGFAAGFFAVPLNALLQQRSGREDKGRLIATNNVFNTVGVLLASAMLWGLATLLHLPADKIILILGLLTVLTHTRALPPARFLRSLYPLVLTHFVSHSVSARRTFLFTVQPADL
jgi:acyl-[acyl-carrier-protein]-phospholipid O-acyltransferase/long-chain-fatty-acid--[acyl-carrier-protein] ligase